MDPTKRKGKDIQVQMPKQSKPKTKKSTYMQYQDGNDRNKEKHHVQERSVQKIYTVCQIMYAEFY